MKILEINTEKTWRGGERQTYYNIEGMLQQGLTLELLCRKNFPLSKKANELHIPIYEINGPFGAIAFLLKNGKRYDIIHAQTSKAQFYAVLTKWIHRRPVVYTRRVDFVPKGFTTFLKYHFTDKAIAISGVIKNILTDFKIKDVSVISDAIAAKTLDKKRVLQFIENNNWQSKKIIATTASFVQHKDPLTMVEAIAELHKLRNDFVFLHYGSGPLEAEVIKKINELQVSDCYKIMGFIDEVEDFFSVFDVFTMSSEEEGLGSSVLDAFIYKVPVASTDAGGLKEIINGRGLLSPVKNAKLLAENINTLLENQPFTDSYKEKAYDYTVHYHSVEQIAIAYKLLFAKMLEKN
jgi:glycosyltransferase involved in cell wall biosynthesis